MADNTRQVIIRADGFGLHLDNTWNYIYVHPYGVVSSTTAMVNLPVAKNSLEKVKEYPNLGIGLHLIFDAG